MSRLNDRVSRNLRRFREERGLSLGSLAATSGLSKQTLSMMERGMGNPTVQTLESLAAALHISPRMLLVEFGSSVRVIRGADMVRTAAGTAARVSLDAVYGSGWAQTQLIELTAASGPVHHEPEASGSLNQVWVVEGRLRLGPDNEVEELAEGDFIRFPADVHHGYEPLTERVRLHVTTTIPQVSQLERVAER